MVLFEDEGSDSVEDALAPLIEGVRVCVLFDVPAEPGCRRDEARPERRIPLHPGHRPPAVPQPAGRLRVEVKRGAP